MEENNPPEQKEERPKQQTVNIQPIAPLDEDGATNIQTLKTFFGAVGIRQADSSIEFSQDDFENLLSEEAIAVINDMLFLHEEHEKHVSEYTDEERGEEGWITLPAREILKRILEVKSRQ